MYGISINFGCRFEFRTQKIPYERISAIFTISPILVMVRIKAHEVKGGGGYTPETKTITQWKMACVTYDHLWCMCNNLTVIILAGRSDEELYHNNYVYIEL